MSATHKLVLASGSPRRLQLLQQVGVDPDFLSPVDADETPKRGEVPRSLAKRLAKEKAALAVENVNLSDEMRGSHILAADTVVGLGRRILPKAELLEEAEQCLRLLAGRNHRFGEIRTAGFKGFAQICGGFHRAIGVQQVAEENVLRVWDMAGTHALAGFFGFTSEAVTGTGIKDGMVAELCSARNLGHVADHVAVMCHSHMAVTDHWRLV